MKRLLRAPRITTLSLTLFLFTGIIVLSDTGCRPKAACGTRREHRIRKKRVHKFAPSMGMVNPSTLKNGKFSFC